MTATVTGITKNASKYGGHFYYMFFRDKDGVSRRSCLDPKMGNFARWQGFIQRALNGEEFQLTNLLLINNGTMVDADSYPKEV
jgi:hypothetical protein